MYRFENAKTNVFQFFSEKLTIIDGIINLIAKITGYHINLQRMEALMGVMGGGDPMQLIMGMLGGGGDMASMLPLLMMMMQKGG